MAEGQQRLDAVQQAGGVIGLGGHGGGILGGVHRQVDILCVGGGEAVVCAVIPLHRGTRAGAEVAALLGGQRQVAHTDLIAVVDKRRTGQRKEGRIGQAQFLHSQAGRGADRVVVAGDKAPQTVLVGSLVGGQILVQELVDTGAGVLAEVRLADIVRVGVCRAVVVAHQPAVPIAAPLKVEVHVKAVFQRHARAVPLGHKGGLRVLHCQHIGDIAPDLAGVFLVFGVVLDQAGRHINAEAVAAHVQPETHNVLHGLDSGDAGRVIGGLLPLLVDLTVTVVQRRLALEEVENVGAVARGLAADEGHTVAAGKAGIRPDEAVGVFVLFGSAAGLEPLVFLAGVAGDEVKQDTDALLVGSFEEGGGVLVRAVARGNLFVVAHVVTGVFKRRVKARIDPQSVAAQALDVVQLGDNALQVADTVAVGIVEALGIDFIEYCVFEPLFHGGFSFI